MEDVLDLDAMQPEPKRVKLGGKIYEINPTTLEDFIAIQKMMLSVQKDTDPEKQLETMENMKKVLKPFIPQIEEMRLTLDQMGALLRFAYASSVPANQQATEKKTESESQNLLPTS